MSAYARSVPGEGIENVERTGRRDTKLSPILRRVVGKTHFDVDFAQRNKLDPWRIEWFAEVKDQYDGSWRELHRVGEWCAVRQSAWSWSKAHPEYPPALALLIYVRANPAPQLRFLTYTPDVEVDETTDVMRGSIEGPVEAEVDEFVRWVEAF